MISFDKMNVLFSFEVIIFIAFNVVLKVWRERSEGLKLNCTTKGKK